MARQSRICPSCGGRQYLRTSHRGKAGTWRCVACGRVDNINHYIPVREEIVLAVACEKCGENLRVRKEHDASGRIPYCPTHGRVFI